MDQEVFGLVADVGGTNTRLGRVGTGGVVTETVVKMPNDAYPSFTAMAKKYLVDQRPPKQVVVAVAGPVAGQKARLTNRNWDFDTREMAQELGAKDVHLVNDLEALGAAVPTVSAAAIEPLHKGAMTRAEGQALVVGLGTGFNVAAVDMVSGAVFSAEQGHASLPNNVVRLLETRLPDVSAFQTVENLFSGVGMLRLAGVLGLNANSAEEIATSSDPKAQEAVEICTDAFALMLRELAYMYFPRAGIFFNGSLAQLFLSPERRGRVLAPLRSDDQFDGQFSRIPAFLFTSDTVALGGCAARLLGRGQV